MKTVLINCSPKKKLSVSSYFLTLENLMIKGQKVKEKLRNKSDHQRILQQLSDADHVVFCLPLYVDGIPSHVLRFLEEMESFIKEDDLHLDLYAIANNGFIKGKQNEPLMQIFENFCHRAQITWEWWQCHVECVTYTFCG